MSVDTASFSIAQRIAEFKRQHEWSDAEFARRMGIHATNVPKYLRGEFNPIKFLPRLRAEGADVCYLLTGAHTQTLQEQERTILELLRMAGCCEPEDVTTLIQKARKFDQIFSEANDNFFNELVDKLALASKMFIHQKLRART